MSLVQLNKNSGIPKYRQIILSVEEGILSGELKKGDKLPSLNKIKSQHSVSRDTVIMAFNELKNRGIIHSIVGKGYYVSSVEIGISKKVFVLFDELNSFKEELYNALISALGENVQVDVYFHHFNKKIFSQLIYENLRAYSHYVIMPANLKKTAKVINLIQKEKVYILDQVQPEHEGYPAVFQNFEKDIYSGLLRIKDKLKNYMGIQLFFNSDKQPQGILEGFVKFCTDENINYHVEKSSKKINLRKRWAYIVLDDKHLIYFIKTMKDKKLRYIQDVGLISYNDSLLKEVIGEGITTISTDFKAMGKQLAHMILNKERTRIENQSIINIRKSV